MDATCFLLGIVRTFQGFIYDIYFSNSLYEARSFFRQRVPNNPTWFPSKTFMIMCTCNVQSLQNT